MTAFGAVMAAVLPLAFRLLLPEPRTRAERDLLAEEAVRPDPDRGEVVRA